MDKFNLEQQYQEYLKKINLQEEKMPSEQKFQLEFTFMAACEILLNEVLISVADLTEDEAIQKLNNIKLQLDLYFKSIMS